MTYKTLTYIWLKQTFITPYKKGRNVCYWEINFFIIMQLLITKLLVRSIVNVLLNLRFISLRTNKNNHLVTFMYTLS